ncbi:MAG: hypothetical protein B6229_01600 [Spirochaetaceae bacterium 4572_7]|nr:MAG: hypothetical protein B6229_01600 [Spirochaetaceae bacterium 4572_7]
MNRKLDVKTPGRLSYLDALKLQEETQEKRKEGTIPDTIIILEHPPVITTGRREQGHNIFVNPEKVGAELVKTNRGGEVTYHGPGQIVGYIIMDLHEYGKGIKDYISDIEEVLLNGESLDIEKVKDLVVKYFKEVFNYD